jgi:endonuclease/exonuclease/phosphatase family metal-dependent hydrolase
MTINRLLGVWLLALGTMASLAANCSRAAERLQVRVLSYNIHHGEGVDGKLDLPRITRLIKSVSPDIVAVQEVDRKTARTNRVDQPQELSRLTGMKVVFERNIRFEGGDYGNAVLSRWRIERHKNHHLPSYDDGEQRGVLEVELAADRAGDRFLFFCTHLDHRRGDRERIASAKAINALAARRSEMPAILAGDLNAQPDSAVLREFESLWRKANEEDLPTVPVAAPRRQIDYILFRPADRWRVIEVRVLDEAVASDHRAIFAVLELKDDAEGDRQ